MKLRSAAEAALTITILLSCISTSARADLYDIDFTVLSGSPAPTASFDYSGGIFSNFIVAWNGSDYDLTSVANDPASAYGGCNHPGAVFQFFSNPGSLCNLSEGSDIATSTWSGGEAVADGIPLTMFEFSGFSSDPEGTGVTLDTEMFLLPLTGNSAQGTFTTTDESAVSPEPGSLSSMLVAGALVGTSVYRRNRRRMLP